MLDVDDELGVWRTKVSGHVLVCAEVPGSVLFCWSQKALKSQTECCRNSVTLTGSLMPLKILEPTSCPMNCCAAVLLPSVQSVLNACLVTVKLLTLFKTLLLGTCYQILNCFYSLCQLFIVYIVFKMAYFISDCF